MKFKITKEEFEKLPELMQKEYAEKDGAYTLNLEGHEDAFVDKGKLAEVEKHRREAEKKASDGEKRETDLLKKLESADGKKEVEALRKSHEEEVGRIKAEYEEKEKAAKAETHKAMIAAEAQAFASEKFTVPGLVQRAIAERMTVEEVNGKPVIRVLEADGSPSVKSLGDLQKEFLENKEFAPIIKGSQGSGSGASPSDKPGSGASGRVVTKAEFEAMSQEERHEAFVKDGAKVAD